MSRPRRLRAAKRRHKHSRAGSGQRWQEVKAEARAALAKFAMAKALAKALAKAQAKAWAKATAKAARLLEPWPRLDRRSAGRLRCLPDVRALL